MTPTQFSASKRPVILNVATDHFVKGQARLVNTIRAIYPNPDRPAWMLWTEELPDHCPPHQERPYAFKAFAMEAARDLGYTLLVWLDASMVLRKRIDPILDYARGHGAWFSRNGYRNSEWTNLARLADLQVTAEENHQIEHVVGGAFAVDLTHPKGLAFYNAYLNLARNTQAFVGPWVGGIGVQHRHDQTASSVLCHKLEIPITNPPEYFAYAGSETDKTILVADGSY